MLSDLKYFQRLLLEKKVEVTKQRRHQVLPSWKMTQWTNKDYNDFLVYIQRSYTHKDSAN